MRVLVAAVVLLVAACAPPQESASAFRAPSDRAAESVVRAFLDAAKAGDAPRAAERLCDHGGDAPAKATAALAGPLRIQGYAVTRVEPAWVGAEPYFRVDVELTKASGQDARSLAVRAREGCVDRLWGEPVEAAKRPAGEIAL